MMSKMISLKVNPFLGFWIIEVASGGTLELERVVSLSLEQRVKRAHYERNLIWWGNFLRGRAERKMLYVQNWWDTIKGYGRSKKKSKVKTGVVETMVYATMFAYKIWKVRCEVVMKKVLLKGKRMLM